MCPLIAELLLGLSEPRRLVRPLTGPCATATCCWHAHLTPSSRCLGCSSDRLAHASALNPLAHLAYSVAAMMVWGVGWGMHLRRVTVGVTVAVVVVVVVVAVVGARVLVAVVGTGAGTVMMAAF